MKGPGGRGKFDVRRVWECPACHRLERSGGNVVNRLCPCQHQVPQAQQVWMNLIENVAKQQDNEMKSQQ